jgi:rhodanese-related sulfurtransferase
MAKKKKTKTYPSSKQKPVQQPSQKHHGKSGERIRLREARQAARRQRMRAFYGIAAVAVLGVMTLIIYRLQNQTAAPLSAEVSVQDAYEKYQQGAFLLDVREPDEWEDYHVPDTTLIPLSQLAGMVDELPRDREVVVICRSGNRSQEGRDILLEAGFENVTSMSGGVLEWREAGFPTREGLPK